MPLPFPTASILDTFNRADVNPIAGNWSGPIYDPGLAHLKIVSNELVTAGASGAIGGSWWNAEQWTDMECYATLSGLSGAETVTHILYVRAQNPGSTSLDGYVLFILHHPAFGTDVVTIAREDNGTDTDLDTTLLEIVEGDKVGLRVIGNSVEGWYCPVSTGIWEQILSGTDSTYTGLGYVGAVIETTGAAFDDFGGGAVVEAPVTYPSDDPPIGMHGRGAGW